MVRAALRSRGRCVWRGRRPLDAGVARRPNKQEQKKQTKLNKNNRNKITILLPYPHHTTQTNSNSQNNKPSDLGERRRKGKEETKERERKKARMESSRRGGSILFLLLLLLPLFVSFFSPSFPLPLLSARSASSPHRRGVGGERKTTTRSNEIELPTRGAARGAGRLILLRSSLLPPSALSLSPTLSLVLHSPAIHRSIALSTLGPNNIFFQSSWDWQQCILIPIGSDGTLVRGDRSGAPIITTAWRRRSAAATPTAPTGRI